MKKAIFLDRDGTLIEETGYLKMLEDMRFTFRAPQALSIFHDLGYLILVITNQSALARGLISPTELHRIHRRLKELAREEGGVIDEIFFCPHLPDGRVPDYSFDCNCRKPKPGMILQAAEKHRLDLSQCFMVGDKTSDLQLAVNAGVQPILVLTGYGKQTKLEWTEPVSIYNNLYEFALSLKGT